MDRLERVAEADGYRRVRIEVECSQTAARRFAYVYLKPGPQLVPAEIRQGPLAEYTRGHAALYSPRTA